MNPFQKFGIAHLSPSSLNCWRETPGLWALRYLGKVRDDGSPAMWRGTAVEKGVEAFLLGKPSAHCVSLAEAAFDTLCQGEISDGITKERTNIAPMLRQAAIALSEKKIKLAGTQIRIETQLEGVSVPVIGYVDFTFLNRTDNDIDLKTTSALPSKPRLAHVRQVATYNRARKRPQALLYVTDKKHALYEISDEEMRDAIDELTNSAQTLERYLAAMPDALAAMRSLPHQLDHYAYGDAARAKVRALDRAEDANGFDMDAELTLQEMLV